MAHLIAGNWKMNGTPGFAQELAAGLAERVKRGSKVNRALPDIAVLPPAPLLSIVGAAIAGSVIALGAQDCHGADSGAHTGDVSAVLLAGMGCRFVIVGHSERRANHHETDSIVQAKAKAALRAGLIPIVCVGETEAERVAGETAVVITRQFKGSLPDAATAENSVIAYEPVWAIGTGRAATAGDIADVHSQIRELFGERSGGAQAGVFRILYGGSVKGANAAAILAVPGVNGALVGGASLDLEDFWRIIEACP